jgi:SnoaL-like domain
VFDAELVWHNSGFDATSGDRHGIDDIMAYPWADNHLEDYRLEVVDMLASDERVAVFARTSGRRDDKVIVNDFIQESGMRCQHPCPAQSVLRSGFFVP